MNREMLNTDPQAASSLLFYLKEGLQSPTKLLRHFVFLRKFRVKVPSSPSVVAEFTAMSSSIIINITKREVPLARTGMAGKASFKTQNSFFLT